MGLVHDWVNRGLAFAGGTGFFEAAERCLVYVRDRQGYEAAVVAELAATPSTPPAEDALFQRHAFIQQWLYLSPALCLRLWSVVLAKVRHIDPARYATIHKGSPFYFMAMAAYMSGDFDRFATMLDAAVAEDHRAVAAGCWNNPAGKWLTFDTSTLDQAAYHQNVDAQQLLDEVLTSAGAFATAGTSRHALIAKLTVPVFEARPELRGVVAALIGFLLQHRSMMREIRVTEGSVGAGGRAYGYLFRGCAVFESIVRLSADGQTVVAGNAKATLNAFMGDTSIHTKLGFSTKPQGLPGVAGFDDIVPHLQGALVPGETTEMRSIRLTWALRNTTGHNLGATSAVTAADAEKLGLRVVAAICSAVTHLY